MTHMDPNLKDDTRWRQYLNRRSVPIKPPQPTALRQRQRLTNRVKLEGAQYYSAVPTTGTACRASGTTENLKFPTHRAVLRNFVPSQGAQFVGDYF